ncbi:MAG: hypothetical protein ACRELG_06595 [Gemmataceae bacterium]
MRLATLAELLSGSWSGTWTRVEQTDPGVTLRRGMLTLPTLPPWTARLSIHDEGNGRFRGTLGKADDEGIVGIWKYESGRLVLCFRGAKRGYPKRFSDEERQDMITLWQK